MAKVRFFNLLDTLLLQATDGKNRDNEYILTNYRYDKEHWRYIRLSSDILSAELLSPSLALSGVYSGSIMNQVSLVVCIPCDASYCSNFWNLIVNIWTHLLGALIYSLVPLDSYPDFKRRYPKATFDDILMLGIFFSGVTICFAFSTMSVSSCRY